MTLKRNSKREGGFTLIELVSVVIILGILAAVIVPKYFDMTGKAQDAAYRGAITEGVARFNMAYATYLVEMSKKPTALADLGNSSLLGANVAAVGIGDYTLAYTGGGTGANVVVTLSNAAGTALKYDNGSAATTTFAWPN